MHSDGSSYTMHLPMMPYDAQNGCRSAGISVRTEKRRNCVDIRLASSFQNAKDPKDRSSLFRLDD
jgi:polysaccharide deacetylase 2 family uncharacterized protein YibQ